MALEGRRRSSQGSLTAVLSGGVRSDQQSAICLIGGARSGKGNFVIPWLVDGALRSNDGSDHLVLLDYKAQDTPVAALQVAHKRRLFCYNPRRSRNGLPFHRFSALGHLKATSASLVSDALLTAASWIPFSDPRAAYFEGMAQKVITALLVTKVREQGEVSLPEIADATAGLGAATDEWLSIEFDISQQPEPAIREVATMLQQLRERNADSGGWEGIKNEISRSFTSLVDPQVREALSPPYDFCFSMLTEDDGPPSMVSIMEDLEYAEVSSPIIRALFTCALVFKRRNLSARKQFWCLNEIGNIGAWPLAETLATVSAGYGIRTAYVVQSLKQLENLKKGASEVIPNSCGTLIAMGIRSLDQASMISRQLGKVTLRYDDFAQQEQARAAKTKAMNDVLFRGADPLGAMMEARHHTRLAAHRSAMARDLRTPDEVMGEENDRAFVFMPGVLRHPFYAHVPRYWTRRDLAGAFLPDPFHPSDDGTVEVATRFGQRRRRVMHEAAPRGIADWPQYRDTGTWSYIKGFRPRT